MLASASSAVATGQIGRDRVDPFGMGARN